MRELAIVFGTYQRVEMLRRAVASVRHAAGKISYRMIIVDGGSIDGSREWLREQDDVVLIEQELPLTGAVRAFNIGFGLAVDLGFDFVAHLNDDAEIATENAFEIAIARMKADPEIGELAFAYDLYRPGQFTISHVNGKPYANYGVIRRDAGIAVAIQQGDPSGHAWWNPIYRTYGADTEFGCWLWRLGWRVEPARDLQVRDHNTRDAMRELNESYKDGPLFWSRWRDQRLDPDLVK